MHNHKILTACFSLISLVSVGAGCGDGYVPPAGPGVIIDGEEQPAGSAGVSVTKPTSPLIEGGASASIKIKLLRKPTAPVTLELVSTNDDAGTIDPSTLIFNETNWSQSQEVVITPGDDTVANGDTRWQIKFTAVSEDTSFVNEPISPLNLTTKDNDVAPQLVITPVGAPTTTEAGGEVTLKVVLTRQPSSEVLIPVQIDDPSEASTETPFITFDATNWNIPSELVITGLDDLTKDGDVRYKVILGPANSSDAAFNGIGPSALELTNLDGVCGNGVVDGKEGCEPQDGSSDECEFGQRECMVCSNSCEYVPGTPVGYCGDGQVQADGGEQCDEPTTTCEYGQSSCQVCGPKCTYINGAPGGTCGDGQVQAPNEQCDGPKKACDYGQMSCMTCQDCKTIPGEVTGYCGDGVIQADKGEECEGSAMCPNGGTASCVQCKIDSSMCQIGFDWVVAGGAHNCGLRSDGVIKCWGSNSRNQQLPSSVTAFDAFSADGDSTCVSTNTGVRCYGEASGQVVLTQSFAQLELMSIRTVFQGMTYLDNSLCGLTFSGRIYCDTNMTDAPELRTQAPTSGGFVDVAVAYGRACALSSFGAVSCWGPTGIVAPQGNMTDIVGAGENFCGIRSSDQKIVCWGDNPNSSLTFTPSAGGFFTIDATINNSFQEYGCALNSTGMTCWGSRPTNVPSSVPGNFTQVSLGREHVCAVKSNKEVQCWGSNQLGQLNVPAN